MGGSMKQYIETSLSYDDYLGLIDRLLAEDKTTGPNQSAAYVNFTRLNRQRMNRIAKTNVLQTEVADKIRGVDRRMTWLVITEAWCGDAAQNIPVIETVARASERIDTRYILRDEHLELIDAYLTNDARAIPKLIALDAETHEVLGTWGSRPSAAQGLYDEMKRQGADKSKINEALQRWYNADMGHSLQIELADLAVIWSQGKASTAGVR